jgi:hypothetical protein
MQDLFLSEKNKPRVKVRTENKEVSGKGRRERARSATQVRYGKTTHFNLPRSGMDIRRANRAVIARSAFNAIDLIPGNRFPPIS